MPHREPSQRHRLPPGAHAPNPFHRQLMHSALSRQLSSRTGKECRKSCASEGRVAQCHTKKSLSEVANACQMTTWSRWCACRKDSANKEEENTPAAAQSGAAVGGVGRWVGKRAVGRSGDRSGGRSVGQSLRQAVGRPGRRSGGRAGGRAVGGQAGRRARGRAIGRSVAQSRRGGWVVGQAVGRAAGRSGGRAVRVRGGPVHAIGRACDA